MRLTCRLLSSVIQRRPFFVTTPIYYVNAEPHLGHLYTALVADAIQRFEQLVNPHYNIIFSTGEIDCRLRERTDDPRYGSYLVQRLAIAIQRVNAASVIAPGTIRGTDEHGTKIQHAAGKANLSLPQYCDSISKEYRDLFDEYHIQYTDFVRTTEDRHKKAVTHFWNELVKKDYIYKARYSGWYSVNDETFVPETHVRDEIREGENVKVSVESGHKVEWTEETNYMFRLSAFKTHLQEWLSTDGVITPPKYQKHLRDMLSNEEYFPDISVSRPSSRVHWAIRVPNDPDQSIYVWLDALINYLTVTGYPNDDEVKARGRPWPADVQLIGKDILKFHGIYWPAFLMAVNRAPPRQLAVHGHWTVDGNKMSKSLGNVVAPRDVPAPQALRYVLLREATMHSDANYSETKLVNIANSELADTLGNLASRCCGASLNPRAEFPALHAAELTAMEGVTRDLRNAVERLPETCHFFYRNYQFYKAADAVIHTLHIANLFFESQKPWELRKKSECQKQLDVILHITMETLRISAIILQPIIPDLSEKLLDKLLVSKDCRTWQHCETPSWKMNGAIYETKNIQAGKFVLFQRIYKEKEIRIPKVKDSKKKKASA